MAKTKSGARTANLSECQVTPVNGISALRVRVPIVVGIMAGEPLPAVRVRVVEGGDPLRRVVPVAVGLRDPAGDEAAAVGQGDGRVGEARHRHRREREPAVRRGAEGVRGARGAERRVRLVAALEVVDLQPTLSRGGGEGRIQPVFSGWAQ
jgi:hypothetical protein